MLSFIRDKVQGIFAWAIVIMLIIPFALWGINEYFDSGGPLVAAVVDGEEISVQSYQQAYYQQRNRMREMLGAQYDPSIYDDGIKKQAIDDMVQREILFQNASDMGLRVSVNTVIQTIQGIEDFQDDGKFSQDIYTRILQSQGESPLGFEQRVQRSILTQQLFSAVNTSAIVTDGDVKRVIQLMDQKRDIKYLTLPVTTYEDKAAATDEAVKKYFDENQAEFMTAEKVSIEYIELNVADLAKDKLPTDEELEQFYEERKSQFAVAEERKTRHILIAVDDASDEAKISAAKEKATDIKKRITGGGKFEDLAKEFSDDPGSAKMGGDLGYFGRGSMEPKFEETMFAMQVGEVSEPVLTSFGFHIIKLEDIRAEKSKPFAEVKDDLIKEYQQGIAEREYFAASEKITNLAYEVPDSLEDAAGAVELEVKTTELFDQRGGTGVSSNPKVRAAAFSDDVLKQGYNSEPIEIGENHIVVLRLKDHEEKQQQSIDEVKEAISKKIIDKNAREKAEQAGADFIKRLSAGESIDAIAKEASLSWKNADGLKRTDRTIDSAIITKAFKMPHPAEDKSVYAGVTLATGAYVIVNVAKVVVSEDSSIDDAQKLTFKRNLSGMQGQSEFNSVLSGLKQRSHVLIQEDNL